jgi:N-acetylglucosaminyldiphosphoundecaprenol N-acetyl-beta-D-mannosaminyltransferase
VAEIERWVDEGERHYVCVTGVHGVMESQRDPRLKTIHNRSGLTTPDGMPMVWAGRWAGAQHISRVYGPDLMLAVLERACERGWSSYFYGGAPGTASQLARRLGEVLPGLRVAGLSSPPFRPLSPEEEDAAVAEISASGAELVWVGLGTPKQERWMARLTPRLTAAHAVIGVGAAFDMHAGLLPQAPRWVQRAGLEWLYRLVQEPRRLWRRYLTNNPGFVLRILFSPPRLAPAEGIVTKQPASDD